MLGGEGERSRGKPGKKGKKKKDDDAVDSPRPLGMPPSYPISDVSLFLHCFSVKKLGAGKMSRHNVCVGNKHRLIHSRAVQILLSNFQDYSLWTTQKTTVTCPAQM